MKKIIITVILFAIILLGTTSLSFANVEMSNAEIITSQIDLDDKAITEPNSNRYRTVKVHVPSKDVDWDKDPSIGNGTPFIWYNRGVESQSNVRCSQIYAEYWEVYQENIGTGVRNLLYHEYHFSYMKSSRRLTSEPWRVDGMQYGIVREHNAITEYFGDTFG